MRIPALEGRSGSGDGETQAVGVPGTGRKVEEYGVVEGGSGSEVGVPGYDHGVKEAEKRNKSENASKFSPALCVRRACDSLVRSLSLLPTATEPRLPPDFEHH